ncbi:DUF962 domain-containing protein [Psychrobacter sp. UBA6291]|uniref:DUF962 domain-containing protein n=1 Tax=Psychrobacter sp. UBA6291 TaxID=1947357 RepID=UPI00257BFBD2|nr:DUF962 domain-containing protein [Psychrobacter sp. UBA6291]MDN5693988.1 DUF962 domain-containing protein [Psychrobacter sp.]
MNQTTTQTLQNKAAQTENADTHINKQSNGKLIKVADLAKHKFYDFYLNEHQNMACRRLHFAGSSFGLLGLAKSVKNRSAKPLLKGIAAGYACAWVGHFFFEKNKPATFKYPLQSFAGDIRMFTDVLRGNLSLKDRKFDKAR